MNTNTKAADKPTSETMTPEELRAEILRTVDEARAITQQALADERDVTDAEYRRYRELMDTADAKQKRLDLMKGKAIGSGFAPTGTADDVAALFGSGDLPNGGPVSKGRGAGWGKAVVRASSDPTTGRFKGLTPSGAVLVEVATPEPIALGRPVNSLRSLIPTEQTSGTFSWLRQDVRQSNAAVVAEGALKPTSVYEFSAHTDTAKVIAHLSESIPRQSLSDSALLSQFVQAEMFWGVEQALTAEILTGNGTGEHFTGLASTAGVQTVGLIGATAIEKIRTLRRGLTRLEVQGLTGSGWVMHPSDWEAVETLATTDGTLMLQGAGQAVPIEAVSRRLYGRPVISSPSCPLGTAWLIDAGSVRIYERETATLSWSQDTWRPDALGVGEGASDFARNLCAFRAEGRWGFAVLRPSGIVKISLA